MSPDANPAAPTPAVTLTHRWPWRRQEIGSIVATAVAALAVGLGASGWAWLIAAALAWLSYYLYRVGHDRKARSGVEITIDDTTVRVHSNGPLGTSHATIAEITRIDQRRWGSDETLLLIDTHGNAARVPCRAAELAPVRDLLIQAVRTAEATPAAQDLLAHRVIPATRPGT